ncbi:MAG: chemotaxis protein CheC [Epulopiscium sp.]|nr:chemotaxis protein CheC [Candidatus Epulonipiscium sp.]
MPKIHDVDQLNTLHLDVLREIGNIGSGNATTALAKLINKKIDMGVPKVNVLEFKHVADLLGGADTEVIGILFNLSGDITGMMMFVLDQRSVRILVNLLMGREVHDDEAFTDLDLSALQEIGNILAGSYLSSLASLTNLKIAPSIPYMAQDMAGAILSVPAIEFGKIGDKALFIETEFIEGHDQVSGYFILIPEMTSFNKILNALGVWS